MSLKIYNVKSILSYLQNEITPFPHSPAHLSLSPTTDLAKETAQDKQNQEGIWQVCILLLALCGVYYSIIKNQNQQEIVLLTNFKFIS